MGRGGALGYSRGGCSLKASHVPERSCVACRAKRPKHELLRIARRPLASGVELELDRRQRLPGRGAYLCREAGCWQAGITRGGLDRALHVKVPATERQKLLPVFTMGVE